VALARTRSPISTVLCVTASRLGTSRLYPAMPYPSYAHMTDPDIVALYAYFMHGVPPVRAQNRAQ
jgi:hypothetical protein